jgi:phosphoserine aminotransferase
MRQKNDEYILLTEEETFSGIKFPKNRAWYQNADKKF